MFGKTFTCCKCGHRWLAGATKNVKCSALPDAQLYGTGDSLGLWVRKDGLFYCGLCSDKEFPQILKEDAEFTVTGSIFF